jgi:biotin operon repressor
MTHGLGDHPLYNTWWAMLRRCENPKAHNYARYGGRGIKVCEQWHDLAVFIADIERLLGPRPEGCTLDRIENDSNYEPGQVQWATAKQQANNRREPLYRQVARQLRDRIRAGQLTGKLPSAVSLARQCATSRDSVLRAIASLKREGLVVTARGSGTFVVPPGDQRS